MEDAWDKIHYLEIYCKLGLVMIWEKCDDRKNNKIL